MDLGSGNVGIGTTAPETNLDFGVTTAGGNIIHLRRNGNSTVGIGVGSGYGVKAFGPSDAASTNSLFETGTISTGDGSTFTQKGIVVRFDGNVGIGITTPDHLLHVEQTTISGMGLLVTRNLTSGSTDSPLAKIHQNHASDDQICFYVRQDSAQIALKIFNPSNHNNTSVILLHCGDNLSSRCNIYSNGDVYTSTGTDIQSLSDRRIKENIVDYTSGLETLNLLKPRTFTYITNEEGETRSPSGNAGTHFGFIAQEIEEDVPNQNMKLFSTCTVEDEDINADLFPDKISYNTQLSAKDAIYISAIQELSAKVTALENA